MTTSFDAAHSLREARVTRVPRRPFTDTDPMLDEDWGYSVQDLDRSQRLAAGEQLVGAKLGLTSRAKQRTMGIAQPIVGFLTDTMQLGTGNDEQVLARTAQPRVEPEIAFRLLTDLDRPLTPWTVEQAIDAVAVAVEIIDSRYAAFGFRLPDVVADNTSAAGFLLGSWTHPRQAGDLATAGCVLSVDGTVVHTATGAAILGHPLRALVHLSEHLARRQEGLPAGAVVLAGALTDAVPVLPGSQYRAEIRGLGAVELVSRGPGVDGDLSPSR
jgi:2-oxo-3-hexenedioate decarboxylase